MPNNYSNKGMSAPNWAARLFGGKTTESIAFWDDVFDLGGEKFPHQMPREVQERLVAQLGRLVSRVYQRGHQDAKQELRDWLRVEERTDQ